MKASKKILSVTLALIIALSALMVGTSAVTANAAVKPVKVTLNKTEYRTDATVTLGWTAASGASGYQIAKKRITDKSYTYLTAAGTSYHDKNIIAGTIYYYQVRSVYKSGKSKTYGAWSSTKSITTLFRPTVTALRYLNGNMLNINWNKIKGVSHYKLAFKRTTDKAWNYRDAKSTYYNVPNATKGARYYIQVCPMNGKIAGQWSAVGYITIFSYEMNLSTRTLTIKGSGEMPDFEYCSPWYNVKNPINIKVENGITSLSADSFSADVDGNTGNPRNDFQYTEHVELPNTLEKIGEGAFYNCIRLQEINLPKSVGEIGEIAFMKCESLKEVSIPEGVTNISEYLFADCESLESVKLSSKTTKIGFCAFSNTALTEIDIPDSVEEIGFMAFYDCKFKSVTIPRSVVSIGEEAFGYGDNEKHEVDKIKDFTIKGYKGTAAEKYANENGFEFVALD